MIKSFFYLDTNVYRQLIESSDCASIALLKDYRRRFRLSAITLMELMEDLHTCSPNKFDLRKRSVELARDVGGAKIMPAHGEFIAKHLFKAPFRNPNLATHFLKRWLDFAVRVKNRASLTSPVKKGVFEISLNVQLIAKNLKALRSSYLKRMRDDIETLLTRLGPQPSDTRGGPLRGYSAKVVGTFFESEAWKRLYLQKLAASVQKHLDEEAAEELYPSLEAACKLVSTILRQSLCDGYLYERHANDAVDEAQLHYLCDPSLTFVTNDRLRKKIQGCGQSHRVITFDELVSRLEHGA